MSRDLPVVQRSRSEQLTINCDSANVGSSLTNSGETPRSLASFRFWCLLAAMFTIAVGGIRFSDGSMLLAIARGDTINSEVFQNPLSQYVWQSPGKVWLIRSLRPSIIPIGGAFLILASLPLLCLVFARSFRTLAIAASVILVIPLLKVSMQNVGLGDGLVIFCILTISFAVNMFLVFVSALIIAIWHPHQAVFIGGSIAVAALCFYDGAVKTKAVSVILGLATGAAVYFLYISSLPFAVFGREAYMLHVLETRLSANLLAVPIIVLPFAIWFWIFYQRPRFPFVFWSWLFGLGMIALATTDVSRVFFIVSLPVIMAATGCCIDRFGDTSILRRRIIIGSFLSSLAPVWSWSGVDIFLWPDLIVDICKWTAACTQY